MALGFIHCEQLLHAAFRDFVERMPVVLVGTHILREGIVEAMAGRSHLHVIQIGGMYPQYWPHFWQEVVARLALAQAGPLHMRLTLVDMLGTKRNHPPEKIATPELMKMAEGWGICLEISRIRIAS